MTTYTEDFVRNREKYSEAVQSQMKNWRDGLQRLSDEIKEYPAGVQPAYRREIGELRAKLDRVAEASVDLANATDQQWEEARQDWGKLATTFWQSFMETASHIRDANHVPLGWVQGLADKRISKSEGWAEGFAERPEGSEGWAEGMGEQGTGSAGWAEGYDREKES